MHLTRYYMYRHLREVFKTLPRTGTVLSVSGSLRLCKQLLRLPECVVTDTRFPSVNILNLPYDDEQFDFVIADQVLEHVEGPPQLAIDETLRVLKRRGIAVHTTCFLNPLHLGPKDLWRFSPHALVHLCRGANRIVDVGGWGNAGALFLIRVGLRYVKVPSWQWHPVHLIATANSVAWPIVTWIVLEK